MKTILLTFVLSVFSLTSVFSQTINDVPIKDIDVEYVQIIGYSKIMNINKVIIYLDFGQKDNLFCEKDLRILDEEGKIVKFQSAVDALNFMSKFGYKLVTSHAIWNGNQNVFHYVMRKNRKPAQ